MTIHLRNMTAVYIRRDTEYLLLYRIGSRVVPPSWCGIGGHLEKDELNDPKTAMLRESNEEIGLTKHDLDGIKLRYVTLSFRNGEIRQNYYFFADLREGVKIDEECNEGRLKWFKSGELPYEEMPHTAKHVMKHYVEIGSDNDVLYTGTTMADNVIFHELEKL